MLILLALLAGLTVGGLVIAHFLSRMTGFFSTVWVAIVSLMAVVNVSVASLIAVFLVRESLIDLGRAARRTLRQTTRARGTVHEG